ncbi:von Willebrand factor type A domain protein [Gemmata sp. SH-PL17]|uniref:vWA domain-containing protein n=1 Tax=Gemmata sp. SH-PL17 TaxID=1630693 RepID=UPI00078E58AD|nr:vWA domain-containing protein [Gemmata sp. SH-PL17]AMV28747.1 von Willebrand factor type A domain protein [Gemmata sp. SH-PL17]
MSRSFRVAALAAVAVLALGTSVPLPAADAPKPAEAAKPAEGKPIDIVICLDVSGSMNGLIDSAKIQLWNVVNELARIKPTPQLRVGLYAYGATKYEAKKGWVHKEVDLTEDLDEVYKALNALTTGGGDEYVARAAKTAIDEQKWSADRGALKIVFVCGNEPADQDKQVALADVAALAKQSGIVVNTIYCKYGHDQEIPGWAGFAESCGGRHVNIDQNKAAQQVVVKTEFDGQIIKLGEELNKTYVAYGKEGKAKAENQVAQDKNAAAAPGGAGGAPAAAIDRSMTKAGGLYRNATWDLVDRMKEKDFDITKIKEEDLCDELKKIKPEERLDYLKKKAAERTDLQKKIADLSAQRQKKIDEELAKKPKSDAEKALDEAFKSVIRDQAKAKGFGVAPEKK